MNYEAFTAVLRKLQALLQGMPPLQLKKENEALIPGLQKLLSLVQEVPGLLIQKQLENIRLRRERDRLAIEVRRLKSELSIYAGGGQDLEN